MQLVEVPVELLSGLVDVAAGFLLLAAGLLAAAFGVGRLVRFLRILRVLDLGLELVDQLRGLGDRVAERNVLGVVRLLAGDVVAVVELAEFLVSLLELLLLGEHAEVCLGDGGGSLGKPGRCLGDLRR